jgi:DNA-directed RNA polymerase subunit M/transcription elongation factor TFIIS
MKWKEEIKKEDKSNYRQCGECGSLDFNFNTKNIEERPSTIIFECSKCKNKWEEKIE